MMTKPESVPVFQKPAEWPFVIEFFMVEGAGYRGMAYCDKEGKWRKAFTHNELPGDIHILE